MKWSVPLVRLAGIQVAVHVSFLLLVAFFAFAEAQPGGLGVLDGLIWLLLIFACVVFHELAHSVVARANGADVKAIVLLPIGGVSQIERMPEGWRAELVVAAAGPVASLGLGLASASAALATGSSLWPVDLYRGATLPRLAWLNLVLALFNLLPAFPLDGGRVLRAALERRHSVEWATHTAARTGRAFGALMVAVGFFYDLWLTLIGLFIFFAATQEERSTTIHAWLRGVHAEDLMRSGVSVIDGRLPALAAVGGWTGPQVVTLDGRYYGLADGKALSTAPPCATVADVTDRDAPTLQPGEDLGQFGLDELISSGYRALAVVDDTRVVGVVLIDDVLRWINSHDLARP